MLLGRGTQRPRLRSAPIGRQFANPRAVRTHRKRWLRTTSKAIRRDAAARRLLLAVTDFGTHATFLAAQLPSTFSRLLYAQSWLLVGSKQYVQCPSNIDDTTLHSIVHCPREAIAGESSRGDAGDRGSPVVGCSLDLPSRLDNLENHRTFPDFAGA